MVSCWQDIPVIKTDDAYSAVIEVYNIRNRAYPLLQWVEWFSIVILSIKPLLYARTSTNRTKLSCWSTFVLVKVI